MIRQATIADIPRVMELLHEMHANSKFAKLCRISDATARQLLVDAIARLRSPIQFGTYFVVAMKGDQIEGFMLGILDRIYHIGSRLVAQDAFLYLSDDGRASDVRRMVHGYIAWAKANPKVLMVNLSWTDTLPGAEKIEGLYRKLGFERAGGIFSMIVDEKPLEIAA